MRWRLRTTALRIIAFITGYPQRIIRWVKWLLWITPLKGRHRFYRWCCGLLMLTIDLTPLSLIYSILMDVFKIQSRPMTSDEIKLGETIFGQSIPWALISMDPESFPSKRNWTRAYVQFHTINFYMVLPDHVLIHELVHIWQYETMGSAYITEALWAQRMGGGYNYGGGEKLRLLAAGGLGAFNLEQQADIIEDYFRWKKGLPLQWAINVPGIGALLERYAEECKRVRG